MKNQSNFFLTERPPSPPIEQTSQNSFEVENISPGKPKKINIVYGFLSRVKRKYAQEKQSRNYWNSIN